MFLCRETLKGHCQLPNKANKSSLGNYMYGVIGMSASSLHRESTDSLLICMLDRKTQTEAKVPLFVYFIRAGIVSDKRVTTSHC